MKKKVQARRLTQDLAKVLMSTTLAAVFTVACTKSRDPEIKDQELSGEIFEKAALQGKEFTITTGGASDSLISDSKMVAGSEKANVQIKSTTAPAKLARIFTGLSVQANQGQNYAVRLIVDKNAMHVLKVVKDESELSTIEKQTRIVEKGRGSLVPLFNVRVSDFGRICQDIDDNGDKTSRLNLCHTDFESATHVRLSVIRNDRSGYFSSDEMKEIFLANKIEGQVLKLADLKQQLNIALEPVEDVKVVSYVVPQKGSQVQVLIYKLLKKSEIKDEKLLKKLNSEIKLGEIGYCSDDVKKSLSAEEAKDCVMVLSYTVDGRSVQAETKTKDDMGEPTLAVSFKSSEASKALKLIQVSAKTPATTVRATEVSQLNPYNTIRIMDLKGKEFLLRRTFEDSASPIQVFGPGASGELDIVKFEFEEKRLVVRRATAVNGDKNPGAIDREELMSIPVQYLAIDPSTATTKNPKLIEATKDSAQYVVLDWANNSLPALNSPLSYFENGQCFLAVGDQSVTDLDNRIVKGVLNFSISGSYAFKPDCMSQYRMNDYWYGGGMQSNFNIKERVSFKLHTGDLDNKAMDLPFRAQNLLGFGVFTAGKLVPDQFGNGGKVDTELSRLVIHDFSNGKQLVYHLGGLPDSGWMRDKLIEGTKEVIAEWNEGLRQAFKGTSLQRSSDYVVLKIDGIDAEPGRLGDLDRNYIWNFEKNLDSGLLGMSQAGPNPRSGRIEHNNVLMYGGNLLSNIGSFKEVARLQKEYELMKKKALAEGTQPTVEAPVSPVDPNDPNGGLIIENGRRLLERLNTIAAVSKPQTPNLKVVSTRKAVVTSSLKNQMKDQIQGRGRSQDLSDRKSQVMSAQTNKMAYIEKIFRKAIEMNATRDELTLNALSAAEILKAYGKDMTVAQRETLALQSRRLALMAEFHKNFSKGPNCALTARPYLSISDADPDILDDQKTPEVFKSWYKSTLLHEIGHSLGLTHNFKGSVDQSNFAFNNEKQDKKARNYSSIMDYIPDTFLHYQGPGPYDVRALRVAYTGLIELAPTASKELAATVKLQNHSDLFQNEITLDEFKKLALGDQKSWWDLDQTYQQKVPVKYYNFCTDVHVGYDPTCNRWDLGTNDLEIAQFYADEYKAYYPVLNNRGSRINIRGSNSYVSRVMSQFFAIRPFLEETYLKLGTGQDFQTSLQAALVARDLFSEVVNTPTTSLPFSSLARFQVVDLQAYDEQGQALDGKTTSVLVESKSAQDISVPGNEMQVDTRGIETDKVIALMMLTKKDFSNPRYEAHSIRVSFADLEAAMGAKPEQSLTLITVSNILADSPLALIQAPNGGLQALPPQFQSEVTSMIRYYGGLSASVFLDADTSEDKYNFGSLFRTASSQKSTPEDRFAVAKLDQDLKSPGSLKFWALDNATIAGSMVKDAAAKRALIEKSEALVKVLIRGYSAQEKNDQADLSKAREEAAQILNDLNKNRVLLSDVEMQSGKTAQFLFDSALSFMSVQLQSAIDLIASARKAGYSDEVIVQALPMISKEMATQSAAAAKIVPILGIAQKALLKMVPEDSEIADVSLLGKTLASYLNPNVLEINYGIMVNNLQFLNQILTTMHPEMNRY